MGRAYRLNVLVGRESECDRIDLLIDGGREGRSGVLVIAGEPGIGKSALLGYARERARDMAVLSARGSERESELAFAALHALLRPALGVLERIPPAQRDSLRAALALGAGEDADRLAVYAGTLNVLAEAAEDRPLLVLVDDAQWLDRASAEALLFAAGRVAGEALAVLFAGRRGGMGAFETTDLPQLVLRPLDVESSRALLRARQGALLAPDVEQRLLGAACGNPLALLELPGTLAEEQLVGRTPIAGPLPVTERIERTYITAVRALPPDTQRALLVAAASEERDAIVVDSAVSRLEISARALDAAEAGGLLTRGKRALEFRHPLVRSAVYQAAVPAERRAAHRALADVLTEEPDRHAWHLAAAAERPDEGIAAALDEAAERARARGGFSSQARALERAAELSPDRSARARRLHAASVAAYWAGDADRAIRLAEQALPLVEDLLLRADIRHRMTVIADWHGRWRGQAIPTEELELDAARLEGLDPRRAAALLGVILQRRFQALETESALALAERRLGLCAPMGGERHLRALQDLARAHGLRGNAAEASAVIDEVLANTTEEQTLAFATNIAEPLIWLERYDQCRRFLSASVAEARAEGNIVRLIFELTNLALLELRTGRLTVAVAAASEARSLAEGTGNEYIEACNLATLARVDAVRGNAAECRSRTERASQLARALGDQLVHSETRIALALLALGEGRPAEAVEELEPVAALAERNRVGEPSVLPYGADLAEAYVRLGDSSLAERELASFRRRADRTGRTWALAASARCAGLLAGDDSFDGHFREALTHHAASAASPFERARTELCYGERLRRAGRRVDAREQLKSALVTFEQLGARPFLERARAELRASGETWRKRDPTAAEQLTPQELQITLQVAEGKTNRDVGAALFLSPKTVEFHLTRIYRKLDIHSRAELIRLFASEGTHTGSAYLTQP